MKKERSPMQKFTWERGTLKGNLTLMRNRAQYLQRLESTTFDEMFRLGAIKSLAIRMLKDFDRNHGIVKKSVENYVKNRS